MADRVDQLALELSGRLGVPPYLLGICGMPGSGKSTFAASLASQLQQRLGDPDAAVVVPMDGFHLTNRELDQRGLRDRKGSPATFDAIGFVQLIRRLAAVPPMTVSAPSYDRARHEPVADAIVIRPSTPVVIVEGNYLLLPDEPWNLITMHLDEVWYLQMDMEASLKRVLARHIAGGCEPRMAQARIDRNDRPNALLIATTAAQADRIIQL